jgi:flotillin
VQEAQARAAQAGPLAEATARQAVVVQETEIAQLEADREQSRLLASTVKPAEAEATARRTKAEGERDASIAAAEAEAARAEKVGKAEGEAVKAKGLAEAEVVKARGEAEGAAIKARSDALAANQDAVISQQFVEKLPQIVAAAAEPLSHISSMTVLNGAEGLTQAVAGVLGQAAGLRPLVSSFFAGNGKAPANGSGAEATAPAAGIPTPEVGAAEDGSQPGEQ